MFYTMSMSELNLIHKCLTRSLATRNSQNTRDIELEIERRVKDKQQ